MKCCPCRIHPMARPSHPCHPMAMSGCGKLERERTIANTRGAPPIGVGSVSPDVLFTPDGTILASWSGDNTLRLWDVATGASLATLTHTHLVSSMSFFGRRDDPRFRFIRRQRPAVGRLRRENISTHWKDILRRSRRCCFSPDGTTLASGSYDNTVRLWRVETGKAVALLTGHTQGVSSVLLSPDGTILASTSRDNTVKLWDVATGANLATLRHAHFAPSMSFSPDGRLLATSDNKTVELWDLSEWTLSRAQAVTIISGDNQEGATGRLISQPTDRRSTRSIRAKPLAGAQVTFYDHCRRWKPHQRIHDRECHNRSRRQGGGTPHPRSQSWTE